MTMPGFTAEASLSIATGHYRRAPISFLYATGYLATSVVPQVPKYIITTYAGHIICFGVEDDETQTSYSLGCYRTAG
jgi:hypothetical protein